jgi:cell division topological specificity factor MinE
MLSKDTAKQRLKLVLIQDRLELAPEKLEEMKKEIWEVVSKYMVVDDDFMEFEVRRMDDLTVLVSNIEVKDLSDLGEQAGAERGVAIAREITKLHEEIWVGTIGGAIERWTQDTSPRGEFTLVIEPRPPSEPDPEAALDQVRERIEAGERLSNAVRDVATETGVSRRTLYDAALADRDVNRP